MPYIDQIVTDHRPIDQPMNGQSSERHHMLVADELELKQPIQEVVNKVYQTILDTHRALKQNNGQIVAEKDEELQECPRPYKEILM